MHVSLSALESALRFVDDLADTDDPADLGRRALPGLDRLIHADVLSYNEFGPEPGQVAYCAYPEDVVFGPDIMAGFEAHVHENPLIDHLAATGDGSPLMISDFLSLERFHRLGVYTEFYRHVPVEHQIAIGLPKTDGRVVGIALNRGRGDFTEDDRDLLAVLRAPLVRAMIRARSRHRARQALTGPASGSAADLTDRELQLLELVALGNTNTAIAHRLGISPRTVAHHLDSVYRKLEVSGRAAAVYRAVTEGIVSPKPPDPPNPPTPRSELSLVAVTLALSAIRWISSICSGINRIEYRGHQATSRVSVSSGGRTPDAVLVLFQGVRQVNDATAHAFDSRGYPGKPHRRKATGSG